MWICTYRYDPVGRKVPRRKQSLALWPVAQNHRNTCSPCQRERQTVSIRTLDGHKISCWWQGPTQTCVSSSEEACSSNDSVYFYSHAYLKFPSSADWSTVSFPPLKCIVTTVLFVSAVKRHSSPDASKSVSALISKYIHTIHLAIMVDQKTRLIWYRYRSYLKCNGVVYGVWDSVSLGKYGNLSAGEKHLGLTCLCTGSCVGMPIGHRAMYASTIHTKAAHWRCRLLVNLP